MSRDWESIFSEWTSRASDAEQDRYDWTRDQINQALRAHAPLKQWNFKVYPKGSYPNNTNVVRDSDVDVAVELENFFLYRFTHDAKGLSLADVGFAPYSGPDYSLAAFKNDVENAMKAHFGPAATRGDKSIHVRQDSNGLKADVVPCVTHREWFSARFHRQGIELRSDSDPGRRIINYPRQHLDEGTAKNDQTSRRYKRTVRILKRLENEMVKGGVISEVCSFLIESSVYNVPNNVFSSNTWTGRVKESLAHIYVGTGSEDCLTSDDWLEANGVKYLFYNGQNWTPAEARSFALAAWQYCGF